jgi:hypothetical protein
MAKRAIAGMKPGSTDTGGYCKARAPLPLTMTSTLVWNARGILANGAAPRWHWRGRRARLVDEATVTLPNRQGNQAAFPQSSSQKAGLGFPLCRVVALLSLACGALLDAATGPCEGKGSNEQSLLRNMLDAHLEQPLYGPQQIRRTRDDDRHQDRLQPQQEPTKVFLTMAGESKKELEIACERGHRISFSDYHMVREP